MKAAVLLSSITHRAALVTVLLALSTFSEAGSLHTAIQENDLALVKQEISDGADVSEDDIFLGSPIIFAAIQGNAEIVELLLEHGALVQIDDPTSGTPLHAAAANGHLNVVEVLIEHGSNIEVKMTSTGETPLHAAAKGGNSKIVNLLISLGADVNAQSNDKYGPIHSAAASEHFNVAEILVANGAAPRPVDPVVPLLDSADAVAGARLFDGFCAGCHNTEKGGPSKTGPNLWDIVNRSKASLSDFDYSAALVRQQDSAWTFESLNAFIARPTDFIPGTRMEYAIQDSQKRAHVITYLRQLSDKPAALPTQ